MNFDDFLQEIVLFINKAREGTEDDISRQTAEKNIAAYHALAKANKGEPYPSLKKAIGEDWELYCLVLSAILYITKDEDCLEEIENIILRPDLDLFTVCSIVYQLNRIRFLDSSLKTSYSRSREINRHWLERYEKEYPLQIPFLPYEKRNKKRIIIETDTFLGYYHAPTRLICDICRTLIRDMGYEVFLFVNVEAPNWEWTEQFWLFPSASNYRQDSMGRFSMRYEDVVIQGYQLMWSRNAMGEMQQLVKALYEWSPLCVWNIGGTGYRHDSLRQLTTVLSMPCADGYSVSEAPVLVSYMQSDSPYVKESVDYAQQSKQKLLNINLAMEFKEEGKNYQKEDFGIPKDAFAISIVGNRLDAEVSEEFEQMLEEVAKHIDRIYFVMIGKCEEKFFKNIEKDRVKYLGWRTDLVDVIKMTDLFVNPPRKGGGGGGVRAISVGVPVVTLPYCDVANLVGEAFHCEDLSEMQKLIYQYETDAAFYKSQQEKVKIKHRESMSNDNVDTLEKMLQQVNNWLEEGEIS